MGVDGGCGVGGDEKIPVLWTMKAEKAITPMGRAVSTTGFAQAGVICARSLPIYSPAKKVSTDTAVISEFSFARSIPSLM